MTDQEVNYRDIVKLMEDGAFDEAAPRLEALVANASDARFHSAYGICLQKIGQWSGAIQQFEAALAPKPVYCEADWRNMLAQSCLRVGQMPKAIEQWRIVAAMEPSYPSRDFPIDEAKRMLEKHAK